MTRDGGRYMRPLSGSTPKRKGITMRIFSTDNPKSAKAIQLGYLNAIHYLAPARSGGLGDVCSHRSPACTKLCLGETSGYAAMFKSVRESRRAKVRMFLKYRARYMALVKRQLDAFISKSQRLGLKPCVRPNGSSDIAWEGIRFEGKTLFEMHPDVQFVDYTKNPRRFDRKLPANYHLTFSRSETNEPVALDMLRRGINVAVVFERKPDTWRGFKVIDGDAHDLRHLDPRAAPGEPGYVIGLTPKGQLAKADQGGFVVREAA